jgi:serine/threonine protein kinase
MDPSRRQIARYVVEKELGRGMMGIVWRAVDPELGRPVALKTVQLAFAVTPEEADTFEKRFLAEARAAARLSHPGIVVVHDVGRDTATNSLYIAFEHLKGRTLQELAAGGEGLEWRQALRIVARVADALHHAHGQGVVHRDIKPANIMILDSGEPKVMDFGIAKVPAERLTSTGQFFGTPSYMSPEQASAEAVDGRSDVFSLGAVLYLLLTSRTAFEGDSVAATLSRILFREPPPASTIRDGLPPGIDHVIARALAKKPADRYPDAKALARDLDQILGGGLPEGFSAGPQPQQHTMVSQIPDMAAPPPAMPPPATVPPALPELATAPPATAPSATAATAPGHPATEADMLAALLGRLRGLPRREATIVGLLGLALVVILVSAVGVRLPIFGGLVPRAQVELNFEHPLRSGVSRFTWTTTSSSRSPSRATSAATSS